ncbi:lectin MOA-related protein [Xenorhabdus sp. KJ12.1]|uniref:lectin MOA-related protein n=1 Tax=Xenorhabdus sp. KJ12.1 TaxID=1851571 RepID=UPI000C03BE4A|nr:lectin MOA-related protein [Xenorhabdus sp. KJ12.1]PHM70130.1 hypothetical protein Xekj_02093 [Xenorhabdus sp. KJ12.1]
MKNKNEITPKKEMDVFPEPNISEYKDDNFNNKCELMYEKKSPQIFSKISHNISYKLRAKDGSLLAMDRKGIISGKRYVFFAKDIPFHTNDVVIIKFYGDPSEGGQLVTGYKENKYDKYFLYANGPETSWNWIYWDKAGESSKELLIRMRVEYAGQSIVGDLYKLIWDNNGTDMFLCRADDEWGYVSSKDYTLFTFESCFIDQNDIFEKLKNTWPTAEIYFHMKKQNYEAISNITINEIYNESGLDKYKIRDYSFTSEDFCYVYKSEASKHAYNKELTHGYAVGIMYFTQNDNTIGAVNVFIDSSLDVYIFNPEFRSIIKVKDWDYPPSKIIM